MREIIESMFEVADWFVLEGAELHYGDDIDPDESGPRPPYIHEARFSDLQVFIGEPVTAHHPSRVVEVAVSLRTGIPLAAKVVDESVAQLRHVAPAGVTIEVFEGDDTGSGTRGRSRSRLRFTTRTESSSNGHSMSTAKSTTFTRWRPVRTSLFRQRQPGRSRRVSAGVTGKTVSLGRTSFRGEWIDLRGLNQNLGLMLAHENVSHFSTSDRVTLRNCFVGSRSLRRELGSRPQRPNRGGNRLQVCRTNKEVLTSRTRVWIAIRPAVVVHRRCARKVEPLYEAGRSAGNGQSNRGLRCGGEIEAVVHCHGGNTSQFDATACLDRRIRIGRASGWANVVVKHACRFHDDPGAAIRDCNHGAGSQR